MLLENISAKRENYFQNFILKNIEWGITIFQFLQPFMIFLVCLAENDCSYGKFVSFDSHLYFWHYLNF